MHRMTCPNCDKRIKFPPEFAGKKVKCPKCRTSFVVSAGAASNDEPAPPSASVKDEQLEKIKNEITMTIMEAVRVAWAHPLLQPMIAGAGSDAGSRLAAAMNAAGRIHADIDATPAGKRLQKAQLHLDSLRRITSAAQEKSRTLSGAASCVGLLLIVAVFIILLSIAALIFA